MRASAFFVNRGIKMTKKIHDLLDSYQAEMIENLQKLIRIKSVVGESSENAPFGENIQKSLEFILTLGKEKGFECINFDNYACEINLGQAAESIGAVLHLDVVPEGSGWTHDPYGGELADGKIFGRGAVDDKGPLIAVFYACCAIKESGLPLTKKIKQIIGTNEEGGVFPCIRYYKEQGEVPGAGIVPDSWFPAVFAEKGILDFEYTKQFDKVEGIEKVGLRLQDLNGGEALNVVAPEARATFISDEAGKKLLRQTLERQKDSHRFSLSEQGDSITVTVRGKSAHASTPEIGVNAIGLLLTMMKDLPFHPADLQRTIHHLAEKLGNDHDGTGLGINSSDHTGELTNNIGLMSYKDGNLMLRMNIRSPITVDPEELKNKLDREARSMGMECRIMNYNPHFYMPADDPLILMLTRVYRSFTGDMESKSRTNGSGSYARILNNFVPFGPSFQDEELCFHKQDEFISCERLLLLSKIYAEALYQLAK